MTSKIEHTGSSESKNTLPLEDEPGTPPKESSSVRMTASEHAEEGPQADIMKCICKPSEDEIMDKQKPSLNTELENLLKEKEMELREEYEKILEREKYFMKERFEFILLNEQTRTSFMLREAHRERQEKIHALQTQLQCKNLAALMYVMCTERRRSRIEKLKIIQDYTKYIGVLQDILTQGQELILHLSRGYKTAARVDYEWREKMKRVVSEFLAFIYNFAGGDPETNQYLIDLPKLLTTKAPIVDNPNEDPCDVEPEEPDFDFPVQNGFSTPEEKFWWDELDAEDRPFIMYGDMADFTPERRREVLKHIKAEKTAPVIWKKYAFRDMFMTSKCAHLNTIKDKYQLPVPIKWECTHAHSIPDHGELNEEILKRPSKVSLPMNGKSRIPSLDIRGMGSILKIITASPTGPPPVTKTALLAARDSMEITSTTRMVKRRERHSNKPDSEHSTHKEVVLDIGKRRTSVFTEVEEEEESSLEPNQSKSVSGKFSASQDAHVEDQSILGSIHNDSLHMKHTHRDTEDKINYEKICPMDQCQRLQVDSFMRSLPPYMRANPFTHFEQTFDEYETCSPEQLEILKQRIEAKTHRGQNDNENMAEEENILEDWVSSGVGVQTSDLNLPPCTCDEKPPSNAPSGSFMFDLANLMPVKLAMDAVHRECFYDDRINFDRFKVIGQDKDDSEKEEKKINLEFKHARYEEIKNILTTHPSLLDIFQANAR